MGYLEHAKKEFLLVGYESLKEPKFKFLSYIINKLKIFTKFLESKNRADYTDDNPNIWIQENVLELLEVFASQGHSGSSAPYCISYFKNLAGFKLLVPLTGNNDEWYEYIDGSYQNKRLSSVFKHPDRFNGQAYDINGKIFWEWSERDLYEDEEGYPGKIKDKAYYTCSESAIPIEFPYMPPDKPIYEYRSSDEKNQEKE